MARSNRSFDQLVEDWEPQLRKSFLDSIYALRDNAQIDQIVRMLEKGDVDAALRAVGLDAVSFRAFDKAVEAAFDAGGVHTADIVPSLKDATGLRTVFQFNVRNPAAESWLRLHSSGLVRDILDDQRTMIRNTLTAGMTAGDNPRTTALDLVGRINKATGNREGGNLGLTDSQAQWVRKYSEELASDKPSAALARALRDKRFDASILKAEREGTKIPSDLREKMVRSYTNRALRYRAEAIARSEAITSLHQAQELSMQQAIDKGVIQRDQVGYYWRSAADKKVREAHKHLNGQFARMGQSFQSDLGPIRFPGDPEASAANRINCRCTREVAINHLAGIK